MQKLLRAVIILGLLLVLQTTSRAAPSVDGFVGVPWGASSGQLDAAMKEQQATPANLTNEDWRTYKAVFAGEWRILGFYFKYNSLYMGKACVWESTSGTWSKNDTDVENAARLWQDKLTEKYGSPWGRTEIAPASNNDYSGLYNAFCPGYRIHWRGLQSSNGDDIEIIMEVRLQRLLYKFELPYRSAEEISIIYCNSTLKQQLDNRGKNNY